MSIVTYSEHDASKDDAGYEDCEEDFEIVSNECSGCTSMTGDEKSCCSSYGLTVTSPARECYFVCSKCMIIKSFKTSDEKLEMKPLPKICPCGEVEKYLLMKKDVYEAAENADYKADYKVVCKACKKAAKVKLSRDGSCYELWSEGRCPICRASPVRISSVSGSSQSNEFNGSLVSSAPDTYKCDNCEANFKVSSEHQMKYFTRDDAAYGEPVYLTILDDPNFLKPGDLILLYDNLLPVLVTKITDESICYVTNEGVECVSPIIPKSDKLQFLFKRIEFLPHDRLPAPVAVDDAMQTVRLGRSRCEFVPQASEPPKNLTLVFKTGRDHSLSNILSLEEKDQRLKKECPKCGEPFNRSSVDKYTDDAICLFCSACNERYDVPDVPDQRSLLTKRYGEYEKEKIEKLEQLGEGDVIKFPRFMNIYSHYAICMKVHRDKQEITVVEFTMKDIGSGIGIIEKSVHYSEVHERFVLRFLPLDCLPIERVRTRARDLVNRRELQPSYRCFRFNCQHFALWCRTNQLKSEDGQFYETVYGYMYMGFNIAALLFPPVRPVSYGVIALDLLLKSVYSKNSIQHPSDVSIPPVRDRSEHPSLEELIQVLVRDSHSF